MKIITQYLCAGMFLFTVWACTGAGERRSAGNASGVAEASNGRVEMQFDLNEEFQRLEEQLRSSLARHTDLKRHPRLIKTDDSVWTEAPNHRLVWTSGFYPGIIWYMYEATGEEFFKQEAIPRTEALDSIQYMTEHHDMGFMMYCSYGNGYRLTGNPRYKEVLLQSARSLSTLFNPKVGTIKSWSNKMHPRWKQHITIIDNMMNLELLYWAAKNGGGQALADMATTHAETTMKNHFRKDYTSWHVLEYDTVTGEVLHRHTKQGYSDDSRWSRGQAWGIYGFTMVYRETGEKRFLDFAEKLADSYLGFLPNDYVPHWDFDVRNNADEERDASAAAITASALIEMSTLLKDQAKSQKYLNAAVRMLNSLASPEYSGYGKTDAFLLHSTGAKSLGREIDVALIYADYYYLEALIRLQRLKSKSS